MPNSISQTYRKVVTRVTLPIMGIVGLMICAVIAMAIFVAHRQTEDALERQRELARGMIDIRLAELSKIVDDYAHWDDALNNLAIRPDPAWADDNIGPTMQARYGVDTTFVIDPAGRTTYGMTNGARSIQPADRIMSSGFDGILLKRASGGPDAVVSGLVLANGRPALVAVAPLRSYDNPVDETRDRRSILAFVDLLDDEQLNHLSGIYRLPDLHIESGGTDLPASVVVTTSDGKVPVRLAWTGDDPGGRLLSKLLPPLLVLLAAFAGLICFVLRQATLLLKDLRRTEERASRDPLTSLLNRSVLMRHLDAMTRTDGKVEPHSLLYLDLDGFKAVNDTFGHEVGDAVLCEATRRIGAALPKNATAYRLGGDEFAVLMFCDNDIPAIRSAGARIIVALSTPMVIGDHLVRVGATIGIAIAPQDGASPVELIRHADEALYIGKRERKGSVRFYMGSVADDRSGMVATKN
ncbi:diguanylate cyclase domain-containing protein [Aureimonas psammosilenae]|uniref:diguanylate cyclase domain-containing protein n=1 Tax=Aureimonas psammosilenae TaxID=2495496 RepID=UPI0012607AFD|nr:diguanylate cyclase [Aureimonas psammosilenae]